MGSAFYSFDEAASRLGRAKRSVHDYVKKGFIKKRIEHGVPVLDKSDVDQLAVELGVDLPAMNRHSFFQMQSRLQKMEEQMKAVMHALELRDAPPLRPDAAMAQGLLSAVSTYIHIEGKETHWNDAFMEQWTDILERVDEETLNTLAQASGDSQAWTHFFRFCTALLDFCVAQDAKTPSVIWQLRAGRLETARKRLRQVVVTWVEMGKGIFPEAILDTLGTPREALLRQVAKQGRGSA